MHRALCSHNIRMSGRGFSHNETLCDNHAIGINIIRIYCTVRAGVGAGASLY